ncbi:hypothetical protein PFISCL1PPCAC_75 [Pristionchus fissidentatus]|uniref:Uncharacterized protein n=1 Tax=Pristionchus fissidentatus TaxID=1538716 RepID=A0AAV5UQ22_9BILA|nr:hypothetical protein PFISCL1PPCAC_75 [Pristionchus fissidentatus]
MRPELATTAYYNNFYYDDGMSQYSITSLLGDSIDSIKKAEFRQRTDSSAAKIKDIVSEIREDVTIMEKRRSRETTPNRIPVPADVRPDPVKQRQQAARNRELAKQFSPAAKFKAQLELEKKAKKTIVRRKFSLVHSLPDRTSAKRESAPSSYSMTRLLSNSPPVNYENHTPLPHIHLALSSPPSSSYLPQHRTSHSLPSSPTTSAFTVIHHQ